MTKRLDGKVAVITGGASGMGLASVELFIQEGARVVAADIQADKGDAMIARFGDAIRFIRCDVAEETDIKAAIDLAVRDFGGLDIMFSNAATPGTPAPVADMVTADWDRVMNIVLRSAMLGIRHSVEHLRRRGGGSIINTSSCAGLRATFAGSAYSTAKAGVCHLGKVAAAELGQDNIRVNTIVPGYVATPIYGAVIDADFATGDRMARALEAGFARLQPIPRAGQSLDIAQAALFLASDESRWVTGLDMVVDGGLMVRRQTESQSGAPNSVPDLLAECARIAQGDDQ